MDLVFFCVLHLDTTNLCAVWLELYEACSLQLASVKGFEYSDEASPHRKFHKAMDAAGLEPIAKRLRNRVPPGSKTLMIFGRWGRTRSMQ